MRVNRRALVLAVPVVAVAVAFVAGRLSAAGIPATGALTYSGTLEDAAGTPLTGTRTVDVYFWSTATIGATPLCSTQANTATLTAGRFSVPLPDTCTSAVHGGKDIWAEVRVDGTSLGLSKLGAVPWHSTSRRARRDGPNTCLAEAEWSWASTRQLARCEPGRSARPAVKNSTP